MGQRDDLLSKIRDSKAIIQGLEQSERVAKTPQERASFQTEIKRQTQYIAGYRSEWLSQNRGKVCPV
jgi:hypothetical protein